MLSTHTLYTLNAGLSIKLIIIIIIVCVCNSNPLGGECMCVSDEYLRHKELAHGIDLHGWSSYIYRDYYMQNRLEQRMYMDHCLRCYLMQWVLVNTNDLLIYLTFVWYQGISLFPRIELFYQCRSWPMVNKWY